MFTLGLFSLISASLIPGLAFFAWTRNRLPLIPHLFASFFFSLGWTYAKTMLLVAVGLLSQRIVILISIGEFLCLMGAVWRPSDISLVTELSPFKCNLKNITRVIASLVLTAVSLHYILDATNLGPRPFWSVPTFWDCVVSWNRWALDIAGGRLPTTTWGYGQMLPALWAYTYTYIGSSNVEIFAKMLTDLLVFSIVLMQLDLILRKGLVAGALGWAALVFFAHRDIGMWTFQATADAPLAAVIFGSFYFALITGELTGRPAKVAWASAILLTGLAAALKQQGAMLLILSPLLFWPFIPNEAKRMSFVLSCWCAALIIGLGWYFHFLITVISGHDASNLSILIATTTSASGGGHSYGHRMIHAIASLRSALGYSNIFFIILIGCVITTIMDRRVRLFTFLFIVPYFFIWALFFSYDVRNVILLLPLVGALSGIGCEQIISRFIVASLPRFKRRLESVIFTTPHFRFRPRLLLSLLIVGSCSMAALGQIISNSELQSIQTQMDFGKGYRDVNINLLGLYDRDILNPSIVSNYQVLCYLHQFPNWHVTFRFLEQRKEVSGLMQDDNIKSIIVTKHDGKPDIELMLNLARGKFDVIENTPILLVLKRIRP